MPKPTFQTSAITRILNAAPDLRYVAVYHTDDEWLKSCMFSYMHRSFVYALSVEYNETEHFIYAGKSQTQYARTLKHMSTFGFDHLYLFECEPEHLSKCEAAVITELQPLFNHHHNPLAERNRNLLGIDHKGLKDREAIYQHLAQKESYDTTTLYGFSLPGAVFDVLEQQAKAANCTCSEFLQVILEKIYPKEIAQQIPYQKAPQTNLVLPKEYGKSHAKRCEQIKTYCRKGRLAGAVQVGRDWVLPRDTRFPEDHRRADCHRNGPVGS